MSSKIPFVAVLISILTAGSVIAEVSSQNDKFHPDPERGIEDQYIVLLHREAPRGGPSVEERAGELTRRFGGEVLRSWKHALEGFLGQIREDQARAMSQSPWVKGVYQDSVLPLRDVLANATPFCWPESTSNCEPAGDWNVDDRSFFGFPQTIECTNPDPSATACIDNWGIDRIDGLAVSRDGQYEVSSLGQGVHVYVVDTGIMAGHMDFGGRVTGGANTTQDEPDCETETLDEPRCGTDTHDYFGHGTNVAAVIGGELYGVAKAVEIHPLRVNDRNCKGPTLLESDFPDALNWIVANHDPSMRTAVVNLSMANRFWGDLTESEADCFREAAFGLAQRDNLILIQSAGNGDDVACTWGFGDEDSYAEGTPEHEAFSKVLIVGGSDEHDGRWLCNPETDDLCKLSPGSNYGRCVDLFAPAAHVVAAYRGDGGVSEGDNRAVCRLSGTSFAAPLVTGAAALILESEPFLSALELKARILNSSLNGILTDDTQDASYIGDGSPNQLLFVGEHHIFSDGFENGDLSQWSSVKQ